MSTNDNARESILQRAAGWYIAHRAGDLSAAERAEFLAWLKRSPAHIEEYLEVASAERQLVEEALAATDDINTLDISNEELAADNIILFGGEEVQPVVEPVPSAHSRKRRLLAIACIGCFVLGTLAYGFREALQFGFGDTYRTAHGQQGSWRLSDGSVLYLNTKSAATVRFNDDERVVNIHYGQARFKVAHEPARRFRVAAGDATVIAVGTEFDVYRVHDSTRITTISGRVAVLNAKVPPPGAPILDTTHAVPLDPGQEIVVDRTSISERRAVDLEGVSAWLQRRIIFKGLPLDQVVAEFNRYSAVPLEIADDSLRQLEISGSFSTYDLQSFLEFLRHLDGVTVDVTPTAIVLRQRSFIAEASIKTLNR